MLSQTTTSPPTRGRRGSTGSARTTAPLPVLMRHPAFRRFWTAQTISYLGDQVTVVALPLVAVLTLGSSALETGLLTAAGTAPNLLFSLHAGAFADRYGRHRALMVCADLARAALLATVPLAFWFGALSLLHLYVVAFLAGTLAVLFNVSAAGLFAAVVPRDSYVQGNSLIRGSYSFSWVAGPSAAGVLIQVMSAPLALIVDTVSFIGSALLLRSIPPADPVDRMASGSGVRDGLAFVRRTPALLAKFAAETGLSFFHSVYFALVMVFATHALGLPAGLIGLALGVGSCGALLGSAVAGGTSRRIGLGRSYVLGALLYPAALALVPLTTTREWAAVTLLALAQFGGGFGLMLCDIGGNAIQQALTPDRLRSRVHGAYLTFNAGARPLGALAGGVLGARVGLRPTLWLAVLGGVASVVPLLLSPLFRMRGLPAQMNLPREVES
ncbi:MFS transporter [Actinoallomurus sp. NPDC052274]|uniref:MFS transporter n=1 Tax=Actinoallomurus sp. NPDC052274 TaxID=3155420 RepID=UPI003419982B